MSLLCLKPLLPALSFSVLTRYLSFLPNAELPEGMGLVCLVHCGILLPEMVLGTHEHPINIC